MEFHVLSPIVHFMLHMYYGHVRIGMIIWCSLETKMMIHRITGFSDFVHRPDSKSLEEKRDVSETGSVSVLRWRETLTLLGPLERAVVQWWRLALSKGPNRVGVSLHLKTETDPVSETSCFSFNYLESRRWIKSENQVIICVIHHRQNPMEDDYLLAPVLFFTYFIIIFITFFFGVYRKGFDFKV
jgi:hypothetical protein